MLAHRLALISKDAFEGAFFANKIVIASPCLIHPSAFAGIQNLRWVVFTSGGAVSCFADEPSADWGDFAFEIVAPMAAKAVIEFAYQQGIPKSRGAAGNRRQPPLTSLLSLAATGSLTAASSGRRSARVSSALLVAALIDRLHVRNLHEMFPP